MEMPSRFPHYRQGNAVDCGPTCLRMVAKYYHADYSTEMLINRKHPENPWIEKKAKRIFEQEAG